MNAGAKRRRAADILREFVMFAVNLAMSVLIVTSEKDPKMIIAIIILIIIKTIAKRSQTIRLCEKKGQS